MGFVVTAAVPTVAAAVPTVATAAEADADAHAKKEMKLCFMMENVDRPAELWLVEMPRSACNGQDQWVCRVTMSCGRLLKFSTQIMLKMLS